MAGLLAADVDAAGAHALGHIAVADLGTVQRDALRRQKTFQPQVGHHRRDHAVPGQPPGPAPILRDQAQDLVAVDDLAVLVGQQKPVRVPVERQAEVGAQDAGQHGDCRRRQRTDQGHVHARADEARDQGRLDHVARQAGVLADHHLMPMVAADKDQPGRLAHLQRRLRRHRVHVGLAANAVRAEQAPAGGHDVPQIFAVIIGRPVRRCQVRTAWTVAATS